MTAAAWGAVANLGPLLLQASGMLVLAILSVYLLRLLLRRLGHAGLAYGAWCLVPLLLATLALPSAPVSVVALTTTRLETVAWASQAPQALQPAGLWWCVLWLAGALLCLLRAGRAQRRFERGLGELRPLPGHVGVWWAGSAALGGPLLMGLLRPRIVVPADFLRRFTPRQQALALAHERVHQARGDLWVNALAVLMQCLFWFHPLVHLAVRTMRMDQELACDRQVLRQAPHSALDYAQALVLAQGPHQAIPLACHWRSTHPLNQRIQALKLHTPGRINETLVRLLLGAALGGVTLACWAAQARATADVAGQRYLVNVKMTETFAGPNPGSTSTREMRMELPLQEQHIALLGEPAEGVAPVAGAPYCRVRLQVRARALGLVDVQAPLQCERLTVAGEPRLTTKLGEQTVIEVGDVAANGAPLKFRLELTVHLWPAEKTWPAPLATMP